MNTKEKHIIIHVGISITVDDLNMELENLRMNIRYLQKDRRKILEFTKSDMLKVNLWFKRLIYEWKTNKQHFMKYYKMYALTHRNYLNNFFKILDKC